MDQAESNSLHKTVLGINFFFLYLKAGLGTPDVVWLLQEKTTSCYLVLLLSHLKCPRLSICLTQGAKCKQGPFQDLPREVNRRT